MDDEQFGTTSEYLRAFKAVLAERIPGKQLEMLQAHLAAPGCATTWARLSEAVGYPTGSSVNLQYGKFAQLVAKKLGLTEKPIDPSGTGWWLWALVRWADGRDPASRHTVFVLRKPAVEALRQLGFSVAVPFELLPDELDAAAPLREGAWYQVLVNAYERNPVARRLCVAAHGTSCAICGLSFGETYGKVAEGYIHVHHLRPLSEIGSEYEVDPVEDLRPVCPNCHAVLHRRVPAYSIEDVRGFLSQR
jgi:5-methylcytosine-specific restriction protein A